MAGQVSPLEQIHTGLWLDRAHNGPGGLTLTVTSTQGAYLIAFLAIFVRLAAGHFWDVCCWVWFHVNLTGRPRDGLYHQQQGLLRNNLTDTRAFWQFSVTAWSWRKKTKNPILRSLPVIIAALVHFIGFTAAGIFSSKVTRVESNALIKGPVCGKFHNDKVYNQAGMINLAEDVTRSVEVWRTSQVQSNSCHAFNKTGAQENLRDCKAWGRQFVPFTVRSGIPCPFESGMCVDGLAAEVESDLVDSTLHLGINSGKHNRVQVKKRMQCAPLKLDGHRVPLNSFKETTIDAELLPEFWQQHSSFIGYDYGIRIAQVESNWTFVYANTSFGSELSLQYSPYLIDAEYHYINNEQMTSFEPIPELAGPDRDLTMFFIANAGLLFVSRIDDPIFSATEKFPAEVSDPDGKLEHIDYYTETEPVRVLGCVEQYQWCNPAISDKSAQCTDFLGLNDTSYEKLNFNDKQQGVRGRMIYSLKAANIGLMTQSLMKDSLLATSASSYGNGGTYLPDDQWIREIDHWTSIFWNSMQLQIAQYAVGNGVEAQDKYRLLPDSTDRWMCDAQVVQRSDYSSFNMLGVLVIICFFGFFVLLSTVLDPVAEYFRRRSAWKGGAPWVSMWRRYYQLQVQAGFLDSAGKGDWDYERLVPTTTSGEKFHFPLEEPKHDLPIISNDNRLDYENGYESKLPNVAQMDAVSSKSSRTAKPQSSHDDIDDSFEYQIPRLNQTDADSLPVSGSTERIFAIEESQQPKPSRWNGLVSKFATNHHLSHGAHIQ